jgi:hypothetical protein
MGAGGTIAITGGTVMVTGNIGGGNRGESGTFALEGNAVVSASSVSDMTGLNKGILFVGNNGEVYGDVTLPGNLTVSADKTLTIPQDATLTVPEGVTLINEGTLTNEGAITNNGEIVNSGGTIQGTVPNLKTEISASWITIAETTYIYDGLNKAPNVTVNNGTELQPGQDYELSGKISATNAGEYTLTVKGMGDFIGSTDKKWTIDKAPGNFTSIDPINTTYTPALTLADLTLPSNYTWNAPDTSLQAGDGQPFAATYKDPSGNHKPADGAVTVNVAKASQTGFSFATAEPEDQTYSPTFSFTNEASGGQSEGTISYKMTGGTAEVSVNRDTGEITGVVKAGTVTVTATRTGNDNYKDIQASYTVTIVKASQTGFTFAVAEPEDQTYSPTFSFTNEASGGQSEGAISYKMTGGTAEVSVNNDTGEIIDVAKLGTVTVTATRTGNDNYKDAQASYTVTIVKAAQEGLSLTGLADSYTYGDAGFTVSVSGASSSGIVTYAISEGDAAKIDASTGEVTILKAGSFKVTASVKGDGLYEDGTVTSGPIEVEKAAPEAVIFPVPGSYVYDPQRTLSGIALEGSGDGTFTWDDSTIIPTVKNSGYDVTFIPRDANNYDYEGMVLTQTVELTIKAATPVIKTAPQASSVRVGQSLADSTLTGGSVLFAGTEGKGVFSWVDDTVEVKEGESYDALFTPDTSYEGNFALVYLKVAVAVTSDLADEIDKADEITSGGVYTTEAWTDFLAAKDAANKVLADPYATQKQIDEVTSALADAMAALKIDDDTHGFSEGMDHYTVKSGKGLVNIAAHDWSLHTGVVKVNGVVLREGIDYTSASGSTQTTLLPAYLDTLSAGTHTLRVEFSSGIAPAEDTFVVELADSPDTGSGSKDTTGTPGTSSKVPTTGDSTGLMLMALASLLALLGATLAIPVFRRFSRSDGSKQEIA